MYYFLIILCFVATSFAGTQRIYTNTQDTVVQVASSSSSCFSNLTLLTNSSSACLLNTNPQGSVISNACPTDIAAANSVYCLVDLCYASNPLSNAIYVFNNGGGSVLGNFGGNDLDNPTCVTANKPTASSLIDVLVSDFDGTQINVWHFQMNSTTVTNTTQCVSIPSTVKAAGLFITSSSTFVISILHSSSMQVYSFSGTLQSTFAPAVVFNSIELISQDYLGNVYVYDSVCACIAVLSSSGVQVDKWNLQQTAVAMSHSRNAHYVVDTIGVLKYYNDLQLVSYTATNATCKSFGSSVSVAVSGGAAPYTYKILPVFTDKVTTSKASYTFGQLTSFVPLADNGILYDDFLDPTFGVYSDYDFNLAETSTTHSGNQSISMIFSSGMADFTFYCNTGCFSARYFSRLEFWINPGLGGQSFYIALGYTVELTRDFLPGSLKLNDWTKVVFDFDDAYASGYDGRLSFIALSPSTNPVYLDSMTLISRTTSAPRVDVIDYCLATVSTSRLEIGEDLVLKAPVVSKSTTCNAGNSIDDNKANDGSISVQPVGGVAPYSYNWTFTTATSPMITDLRQMRSNIYIYREGVNASWDGVGAALTFNKQDSTYYRSAPYSYSFAPSKALDDIFFNTLVPLQSKLYYAFEFWMNAGVGGQSAAVVLTRGTAWVSTSQRYSMINALIGLPFLPANKWFKVTVPIQTYTTTFTGFQILGIADTQQPPVYIDDVVLISKDLSITVTDSAGCSEINYKVEIASPDLISPVPTPTNAKCNAGLDGSVTVDVTGGTAPYYYSWSVGAANTSSVASNIGNSIVYFNVTDANGCHAPKQLASVVYQPPALEFTSSFVSPKCHSGLGTVTTSTIGGAGIYTYKWKSLTDSNYSIVLQPNPIPIFTETVSPSLTLMSGIIPLNTLCKGTGPYQNNSHMLAVSGYCSLFRSAPNATQLSTPIATDTIVGFGCLNCIDMSTVSGITLYVFVQHIEYLNSLTLVITKNGTLVANPLPLANNSVGSIDNWLKYTYVFENKTGAIADTIALRSKGIVPGFILVDDIFFNPITSASDSLVTGVGVYSGFKSIISATAGSYLLNITDGNGCPFLRNFTLTQPPRLDVSYTADKNGRAKVSVQGGVPPYTYKWGDADVTTPDRRKMHAGEHVILVTDANGCAVNKTVLIPTKPKSQVGLLSGVIVGSVVVLGVAAGVFWRVYKRHQHVVKALKDTEEGERRAYKIDFNTLEMGALLGAGSFGEVYRGEYKGTDVAIKKLKSQKMTQQQADEFAKESGVMVGLRHPNILLFMGVCLEPERLCIVTEMMPRGDLSEVLRNKDISISNELIFRMALDTLKGLQYIHSSGLIHRDLKSANLLVDKNWNIKISDFGLSCAQRHSNEDDAQVSLLWTAPEILSREPECYSYASDMFSFGIILWEMMTKKLPWEGVAPAAITSKVVGGIRPAVDPSWNYNVTDLIQSAWAQDPQTRPSVREARTTMENVIIPSAGEFDFTSMYDSGFNGSKDANRKVAGLGAPPPQPPLALVVVNVSNSAELWEQDPRGMSHGMGLVTSTLQNQALKLSGYEISTDPSFMYAFANPLNAVNFCLRSQLELLTCEWQTSLLALTVGCEITNQKGTVLHRGLRLHTAIHWCSPALHKDPATGHPTYMGSGVTIAATMSSMSGADSIFIDQEMYNKALSAEAAAVDPFCMKTIGAKMCGSKEVHIFKIVPDPLKDILTESDEEDGAMITQQTAKEPWLVNFEDITLEQVIGTGTFGNVHSGIVNGQRVAVKKLVRNKINGQIVLEMKTECAILRSLNHPNIIKFIGMCIQFPNLCLITELMERGSLESVLSSSVDLPWARRISFAKDIAAGMAYLHKNNIIHRDIKSSNMLVGADWSIRIADFGFSRIKQANQTMTQCGTVSWTAPEIFEDSHYTEKADVFSFGVVLWELIFRKKPWEGKHSMRVILLVEGGSRPPVHNMPVDAPSILKSLMITCWDQSPECRPTFEKVLEEFK